MGSRQISSPLSSLELLKELYISNWSINDKLQGFYNSPDTKKELINRIKTLSEVELCLLGIEGVDDNEHKEKT